MLKGFFRRKERKKVVVLGVDGVPCSLLQRFAGSGVMPNVARLLDSGTLSSMKVSIPEVSSTSWTTFMTGVNPGRHGIYGFMDLVSDSYSWKFPNFNDVKSKTIWQIAGENDMQSVVINLPETYPAHPLKGKLVAGFVALDLKKATYPESLFNYLQSMGYRLDVNAGKAATAMDEFKDDLMLTFRKRQEAILHLYDHEQCDLFIGTITETDRLHHYLWAGLDDETSPHYDFFIEFYRELDRFIGAFVDRLDKDTPFIMLSDHGFTEIKSEVYLNYFLREKGYLKFSSDQPKSFADLDFSSTAFALDPSRIYLHRQDFYAKGCVTRDSYDQLRQDLRKDLLSLQVDGQAVIKEVRLKEDLYSGPCFDFAPDLVCLSNEGFDLKGTLAKEQLSGRGLLTGGHTRENATFFINQKMSCDGPNIIDVAPTILRLLDLPLSGMEGRCLLDD